MKELAKLQGCWQKCKAAERSTTALPTNLTLVQQPFFQKIHIHLKKSDGLSLICSDSSPPLLPSAKTLTVNLSNAITCPRYTNWEIKRTFASHSLEVLAWEIMTFVDICICWYDLSTLFIFSNSCPKHSGFVFVSCQIAKLFHIILLGMKNISAEYSRMFCRTVLLCIFPVLSRKSRLFTESFQLEHEGTFTHQAALYRPQNKTSLVPSVTHWQLVFYLTSKHWHGSFFPIWGMYPPEKCSITFSWESNPACVLLAQTPGLTTWLW